MGVFRRSISADHDSLINKIRTRHANIGIIGVGYVGLPLSVATAKKGFNTYAIDKEDFVVNMLKIGESYIESVKKKSIKKFINKKLFPVLINFEPSYEEGTPKEIKELIAHLDVLIICAPTKIQEGTSYTPDLQWVEKSAEIINICFNINPFKSRLVILESTVTPGYTEGEFLANFRNYKKKIYLAYSPERIDPAYKKDFTKIPKIVSALDDESLEVIYEFYKIIFKKLIEASTTSVAEAVKVIENSYRFVNISFANRLSQELEENGYDSWEIIKKIKKKKLKLRTFLPNLKYNQNLINEIIRYNNQKFDAKFKKVISSDEKMIKFLSKKIFYDIEEVHLKIDDVGLIQNIEKAFCILSIIFVSQIALFCEKMDLSIEEVLRIIITKPFGLDFCYPGPGAGGHCIPIDPKYLYYEAISKNLEIPLINEAVEINKWSFDRVVKYAKEVLAKKDKSLNESKILILGVAYKENVGDVRESPAYFIISELINSHVEVVYCDPLFRRKRSFINKEERFKVPIKSLTAEKKYKYVDEYNICEVKEKIKDFDCAIILTDHKKYFRSIYRLLIINPEIFVVDTRNAIKRDFKRYFSNVRILGVSPKLTDFFPKK